jgi:hypothetical protein
MFMQTPRDKDTPNEINYFFRDVCSTKLHSQHMEQLERSIVETI